MKLRIATRKSPLALVQTRWVASRLREIDASVEVEEIQLVTQGDRVLDRPLADIGGKGLFVGELEAALSEGRADIAVHSMKDLPAEVGAGLCVACVPEREDPSDVLVTIDGAELDALEAGARVGTSSLRRSCQLRALRPDLDYASLRGNVDTRLRRLEERKFRGVILALAGLRRLGLADRPHAIISKEACIPAVGQGALAIEARKEDAVVLRLLGELEHPESRVTTEAERAFLRTLGGSCRTPLGAHARLEEGGARMVIDTFVGSVNGATVLTGSATRYAAERSQQARVDAAIALGVEAAEAMLQRGAGELIKEANTAPLRQQHTGNGGGSR